MTNHIMTLLRPLAFLALIFSSCVPKSGAGGVIFDDLDACLHDREMFEQEKTSWIARLKSHADAVGDVASSYDLYMEIAEEYASYSFDSTAVYLHKSLDAAGSLGDGEKTDRAMIRLGLLYTTAGHFLEAYHILFHDIDTLSLTPPLQKDWYGAVYRFAKDMDGDSGIAETIMEPDKSVYRDKLCAMLDEDSRQRRELAVDRLRDEGRFAEAAEANADILAGMDENSRDYANVAYVQSELCDVLGLQEQRLSWLIASAKADAVNSVRDYAALTVIAIILADTDVDRSFRYMQMSLKDAIAYNAKLRPWQVSQFFVSVEDAYNTRQNAQQRRLTALFMVVLFLMTALAAAFFFLVKRSRELARTEKELRKINDELAVNNRRLSELNARLTDSDRIKEEYISFFLGVLSEHIDIMKNMRNSVRKKLKLGKADELLKEMTESHADDDALASFYNTFDTTFLTICPDFVNEFNALLEDSARIVLKKGEILNTELRIFALIRLGIDDSSRIAALLHYSVSTIYNYKVKIKNGAKVPRERFEEFVKAIGRIG